MIGRIILSGLIKTLYDLPLMILGYFIFPIAYLSRKSGADPVEDTHLPWWADWAWGNSAHGIYGGVFYLKQTLGWGPFWRAYVWSCFRNPTYNSSQHILGYKASGFQTIEGNPLVARDRQTGWYWVRDGWAWEYQYIKKYSLFGKSKCVKFRAGWKICRKDKGELCTFVFSGSPMTTYTGV